MTKKIDHRWIYCVSFRNGRCYEDKLTETLQATPWSHTKSSKCSFPCGRAWWGCNEKRRALHPRASPSPAKLRISDAALHSPRYEPFCLFPAETAITKRPLIITIGADSVCPLAASGPQLCATTPLAILPIVLQELQQVSCGKQKAVFSSVLCNDCKMIAKRWHVLCLRLL